ncbi:MAG: sensor histidine kinase [Tepidiformaceae bacterium]
MPAFARTVRFKLSVWYSSLLLVFGVAFIVALNIAARFDHPDVVVQGIAGEELFQPVRSGPGGAINGFTPVFTTRLIVKDIEDQIYSQNLDRLQTWSLIAVVGLALASGVGGYLFSGMMLRPVRDITKAASEISASNLSLRINHQGPDDELKALADTFDSMIARLEVSFDQQRQFVQDASHELRTPLAAIRTNIDVTEMDPDTSAAEYRELVETIKQQTARLTRLSDDLLVLSSSERETPEAEAVNVLRLVREVFHQLGPLAARRAVALAVQGDPGIEAEASGDLMFRSVSNLVDNAIKYSGEAATVTVRVERDERAAVITVADNGPGIPSEELPHVFDRFYRVDKARSRREGGTGLGLAIVRGAVQAMKGTVGVSSVEGVGSVFTIRLPLAADDVPDDIRRFEPPRVEAPSPS